MCYLGGLEINAITDAAEERTRPAGLGPSPLGCAREKEGKVCGVRRVWLHAKVVTVCGNLFRKCRSVIRFGRKEKPAMCGFWLGSDWGLVDSTFQA